jgi:teichoic acid transport system permease protein
MFNILKEHKGFWKTIFKLAKVDLIKTYRGSALGWAWAIIKPTVTIFIYYVTFRIGLRAPRLIEGYQYFIWLTVGIVPWFYMSEMLTQGTEAIRGYRHLVTKMNFPVSTIPTFVSLSKLFVNLCMIGITILIYVLMGYQLDIYLLQLPFYIIMMFLLFTGWSLFASPLASISRDFANLVKSFTTGIFWLSAIIWDPSGVSNTFFKYFLKINPITYIVWGFRDTFIYKEWFFEQKETLVFLVVLVVMWTLGTIIYKKLRKDIPDVL